MKKLLTFILLIISVWIGSAQTIPLRKPVQIIYGGDTLTISLDGDTAKLYSNHGKFRISDLLKLNELIVRDTTIRDMIAEHGGGTDPHITDTSIYLLDPKNGNLFDLKIGSYNNGILDLYWKSKSDANIWFEYIIQPNYFAFANNRTSGSYGQSFMSFSDNSKSFVISFDKTLSKGSNDLYVDTVGTYLWRGLRLGTSYDDVAGTIRYNSGTSKFEGYTDSWNELGNKSMTDTSIFMQNSEGSKISFNDVDGFQVYAFYNQQYVDNYYYTGTMINGIIFDNSNYTQMRTGVADLATSSSATVTTALYDEGGYSPTIVIKSLGRDIYNTTNITVDTSKIGIKGNAEIDGDLSYNLRQGYAEYMSDYTPDLTQNVYTKVTPGMSVIEADYLTIAGDSVTIDYPGDYWFDSNITISGSNGDDFTFQLRKNNVVIKSRRQSTTGSANYFTFSIRMYLKNLIAGDDISIWVTNTAGNGDATINPIDFYIEKKH